MLTGKVIGAAIEVHRQLGPGLLEASYEMCLAKEFDLRGIPYQRQKSFPLAYKGLLLPETYRIDFLVEDQLIVEIKSVETFSSLHTAQLLSYLRILKYKTGLLLNFNVPTLKDGIRRVSL